MAIIEIEQPKAEEQHSEPVRVRGLPFFPHFLLREVVVMCLIGGSLLLLASYYPAGLLSPADPFTTPTPIYPEWYFLYVFGFLKFWTFDLGPIPAKIIGVTVPMVLWYGLLILVPFIDRNPSADIRNRKIAVALGVIALLGILFFTYYGIVHGE
ncbi:putative respiratory nitrate reductase subunit cytochrome b-561 [uncultured archaeon]|nr:putative respiratory nitrate reductase subunit cytochrome b-561 [uncultured archaeon]